MKDLPGYEEAINLNYSLHSHSGNKESAMYMKGSLSLTVHKNNTATLMSMYKMVILKVENFTFPHKNIELFENQILKCLPKEDYNE